VATLELPKATMPVGSSLRSNRKRKAERDDADLVERLKAGDEEALEALFNRHSPRLYNVAQRILGEVADAEEVIQDVFWTAFRKANSFRGTAQFSTWLYRLTVNAALGKIRRSKKDKEVEYEEYLPKFQKDGHHLVRPVVDWSDTLDEKYAEQELQQLLKDALEQLKPVDKSVVVLSDLEGMSDKEIAETLGLTVPAVKTRLHRARLFLRGKLAIHLGHSAS
jgi:RNA polymerase sigma-70 factor, ECF subfamily